MYALDKWSNRNGRFSVEKDLSMKETSDFPATDLACCKPAPRANICKDVSTWSDQPASNSRRNWNTQRDPTCSMLNVIVP